MTEGRFDSGSFEAHTLLRKTEVPPRKDHRGVDLISDVLPFGGLWYGEPNAISNAIDYAKFGVGANSEYGFSKAI